MNPGQLGVLTALRGAHVRHVVAQGRLLGSHLRGHCLDAGEDVAHGFATVGVLLRQHSRGIGGGLPGLVP